MQKQTVIITGANSGIGKAAALKFAEKGHTVIMACRSLERSQPVKNEIIERSGNNNVFLEELDMSSFDSIRNFCSSYKNKYKNPDILINNAAYFSHGADYQLSADGIELTFATNVFGPYLLTLLLKDLLAQSEGPRILNAGSNIIKHFFNPEMEIPFDNLRGEFKDTRPHRVYESYRNSKMALLMLTFKMAEELKEYGLEVNSLQINGATMSKETIRKMTLKWRIIARIQNLFLRSPEFMANHYYDLCTSEKYKNVTGKQFNHKQEIMQPAKVNEGIITDIKQALGASVYPVYALREDVTEKLWNLCVEWTGKSIESRAVN